MSMSGLTDGWTDKQIKQIKKLTSYRNTGALLKIAPSTSAFDIFPFEILPSFWSGEGEGGRAKIRRRRRKRGGREGSGRRGHRGWGCLPAVILTVKLWRLFFRLAWNISRWCGFVAPIVNIDPSFLNSKGWWDLVDVCTTSAYWVPRQHLLISKPVHDWWNFVHLVHFIELSLY